MEQIALFDHTINEEWGMNITKKNSGIGGMENIISDISKLGLDEKIQEINKIKKMLHEISPFKSEPVDCVLWIKNNEIHSNDYNPNSVAPPEMKLLEHSIQEDGYTQPIVTMLEPKGSREVIDGFHRNRVGKESKIVSNRIHNYLPVVTINEERQDRNDRIASTIRHNRARGKHNVDSMSDIVVELKKRNWSDSKISKELGMDADEVLRLCQITGLAEVFSNEEFSKSWTLDIENEEDFAIAFEEDVEEQETNRIFHTYEKWECAKAGFYESGSKKEYTKEAAEQKYAELLRDDKLFSSALSRVINEWKYSCEHYLSNENMNRIAWLGQASACISLGLPSCYRGGYNLLTEEEKENANKLAFKYLNLWLEKNHFPVIETIENAQSKTKAELY